MKVIFVLTFLFVASSADVKFISSFDDFRKNLQPVEGLYIKPSEDGTTGDLYIAASEDHGVKTPWLAEKAIQMVPSLTKKEENIENVSLKVKESNGQVSYENRRDSLQQVPVQYNHGQQNVPIETQPQLQNNQQFTLGSTSQTQPQLQYTVLPTSQDESQPHAQYTLLPTNQEIYQDHAGAEYSVLQVPQENNQAQPQYTEAPVSQTQSSQYVLMSAQDAVQSQPAYQQPSVLYSQLMQGPKGEIQWSKPKPMSSNMVSTSLAKKWSPLPYYAKYVLVSSWSGSQEDSWSQPQTQTAPQNISPITPNQSAWQKFSTAINQMPTWNQNTWTQKQGVV